MLILLAHIMRVCVYIYMYIIIIITAKYRQHTLHTWRIWDIGTYILEYSVIVIFNKKYTNNNNIYIILDIS